MKSSDIEILFESINGFIWGIPLILLVLCTGIYLTIRLKGIQVKKLGKALKYMISNENCGEGEVTSFGALCTALSATIGTGNIVGVATAISTGGPGALFWMMVASFFGTATKYAEGFLAIKYRKIDADNHVLGGPFYYIEYGMGKRWIWLAKIFALFGAIAGLFGIGTFTQVNGITSSVKDFLDPNNSLTFTVYGHKLSVYTAVAGVIVTICSGAVIIGGIKRIAKVSEFVVPSMAILYIFCTILILLLNYKKVPSCIQEIMEGAFGLRALSGGILGSMLLSIQKGVARGLFSTEAGLGSAPIASSAAKSNDPIRQGLVSMTGTFDTMIICLMTGLSIIVCGSWNPDLGLEGFQITNHSFQTGLPFSNLISSAVLMICLIFFAFTTIIGWNYYGERCIEYLSKGKQNYVFIYRWMYVFAIFIGPYMTVSVVWTISDIFNGLMAIPNIIALIFLSRTVCNETSLYFKKSH